MKDNYAACLAVTLKWEGGWINHPQDPGGATNFGVTQKVYDGFRKMQGKPVRSVKQIEQGEVGDIYRTYWAAVGGDTLPRGVDMMAFDIAVNSGPARAKKWLMECGGQLPGDQIRYLDKRRRSFWQALKTFAVFGKGWMNREKAVFDAALKMQTPRASTLVSPI